LSKPPGTTGTLGRHEFARRAGRQPQLVRDPWQAHRSRQRLDGERGDVIAVAIAREPSGS